MRRPDPSAVAEQYRAGVRAIQDATAQLEQASWQVSVCGDWTAEQTARHVLSVAGWYHDWLDRAQAGTASMPFDQGDMDARTAAALTEVGDLDGPTAVARFVDAADRYLNRVIQDWDVPYGYPAGVVTAGLHCGIAATEWHLHAWDLSGATGPRHRPEDPAGLFDAAASCLAAAQGGVSGSAVGLMIPVGRRLAPWENMLRRSGRAPERRLTPAAPPVPRSRHR